MAHLVEDDKGFSVPVPMWNDTLANLCAKQMAKDFTIRQLLWVSLKADVPLVALELIASAIGHAAMTKWTQAHAEHCRICTPVKCHAGHVHVHEFSLPFEHLRRLTFFKSTFLQHPQGWRFICGQCGGTATTGCKPAPWHPPRPAPDPQSPSPP